MKRKRTRRRRRRTNPEPASRGAGFIAAPSAGLNYKTNKPKMKNKSTILIAVVVLLVAIGFFAGFMDGKDDREAANEAVEVRT